MYPLKNGPLFDLPFFHPILDFIINEMIIYFHGIFEEVSWTYSEVNEES